MEKFSVAGFGLLLFLLAAGLGVAWGVCHFTTSRYETQCECEVAFDWLAEGGFEEKLNTCLAVWNTELGGAWPDVEIVRVPRSRLIAMIARGSRAEDVAARANGCADALVSYTMSAGSSRADAALATVRAEIERLRQAEERLAQDILDVRAKSASDTQAFNLQLLERELAHATSDALEQEQRVRTAAERVEFFERAQKNPENPGEFPASVSTSSEVRRAYGDWVSARRHLEKLRTTYTEEYQGEKDAVRRVASTRQRFIDLVQGAHVMAEEVLTSAKNRLKESRRKAGSLRAEREGMTLRADQANEKIVRLEKEKARTAAGLEEARKKEKKIRKAAEQDAVSVRVVRPASVPAEPLYPDRTIAYSTGIAVPVLLWVLLGFLWPSAPRHRHRRRYTVVR